MFKSTAAVLGFLFALSTAYYLSFWGYFEINVFQYISAEDIVKGVAYPLRFAGIWIAGVVAFALLLLGAYEVRITRNIPDYAQGILVVLFTGFIISGASYLLNNESRSAGVAASLGFSFLVLGFHLVLQLVHEKRKAAAVAVTTFARPFGRTALATPSAVEHPFVRILDYVVVFSAVFFSVNAVISGQIEARKIHSGKAYNYVMARDLPDDSKTSAPYLIFLGAISEKYIFIDSTEHEHFVIDKEKLPVLRIHHFDLSDKSSWPKYKILLTDSLKALAAKTVSAKADSVQAAYGSNHLGKKQKTASDTAYPSQQNPKREKPKVRQPSQ